MIKIYNNFVKDYKNPNMTGEDIKRLNGLNSKQYSKLRSEALSNGHISSPRHVNYTGAKFYTKNKKGNFVVKKQYGNKTFIIGRFEDEKTAKKIVELCKSVNWDINKILDIINKNKIKPKNYTRTNGVYIVEKRINGKRTIFHTFKTEAEAIKMVDELRKCDWDKSKVDFILDKLGGK